MAFSAPPYQAMRPPITLHDLIAVHLADNLLLRAGAGLDALGGGTVEVVLGDPALINGGDAGGSTDGGRNSLVAGESGIGIDIGGEGLARGLGARSLGALSLGKESFDPGLVDEVEDATEGTGQEQVEEDDLGVEEAGGSLNDSGGAIENGKGEDVALSVGDDSHEVDLHILRLHVLRERVRDLLGLASRNLEVVLGGGQVAQDALVGRGVGGKLLGGVKSTGEEGEGEGGGLAVGDGDEGLGRVAVDELDAEDVGVWEGGGKVGVQGCGVNGGGASILCDSSKELGRQCDERSLEEHLDRRIELSKKKEPRTDNGNPDKKRRGDFEEVLG